MFMNVSHAVFVKYTYRYANGCRYIRVKKTLRNLYVYLKYTDVEALKEIVNVSVIFEPSWTVFIPEDKLFKTSHNFYIFHSYFKYLYYLLTFNASKYRLNHKFLILSTTSTLIVGNLFHFPFFFYWSYGNFIESQRHLSNGNDLDVHLTGY